MEPKISRTDVVVAAGLFAAALAWELAFRPFARPLMLDPATWDYMSVSLLEGRIPYRDIFLHKTPLAALLGAAGAWLAGFVPSLSTRPVAGAHAVFLVLGAAAPSVLYLLCRTRTAVFPAVGAALFMVAFDQWLVGTLEGVRPKIATTTFGLVSLLAATRGAWRTSGGFGALATLCWQPGLAFLAGACWQLRGTAAGTCKRSFLQLSIGMTAPVAVLLAWLAWHGTLDGLFRQAVLFNFHYIERHARPVSGTLAHLLDQMSGWNRVELLLLPAAALGLSVRPRALPPSLGAAGLVYFAMTLISFQAWPDTILFAAPVAAMLAVGLQSLTAICLQPQVAGALVVAISLFTAATPESGRLHPPISFEVQARFMKGLAEGLERDDRVLVVSLPEFLVHTGRHSAWPWPYLWFGVDRYASDRTAGGFEALLRDLERDPPALMIVARRWSGPLRKRFEQWARDRYRHERVFQYPHTVRPINVYRRREPYRRAPAGRWSSRRRP